MFTNGGLPGQILQDWSETATLKVKIGAVPVRDLIFQGWRKKGFIIIHLTGLW
jgi:hypothetical protein